MTSSTMFWSPAEIEEIREIAAKGLTPSDAALKVGRTRKAIIGFTWRNGIKWQPIPLVDPKAIVPDDFERLYYERSYRDLCFTYSRSASTIKKWAAKLGLRKKRQSPPAAHRARVSAPYVPRKARLDRITTLPGHKPFRPHLDETPAGQAADFLRRFGPVIRCDERGAYTPNGQRWRRGASILNADEIIERATANGWGSAA